MIDQIRTTVMDACRPFADRRSRYCQLELASLEEGRARLRGSVLDAATRDAVLRTITAAYPAVTFDFEEVTLLRREPATMAAVATNLTGLHTGPGFATEMASQVAQGQALELLAEEGAWAHVRQPDGYLGWVYRPYMSDDVPPPLTHLIWAPVAEVRQAPDPAAPLVTRLVAGTAVAVTEEADGWQRVASPAGRPGWVAAADLRPVADLPGDEGARRETIVERGGRFVGVPYLWGGTSALGIDCSGLAQLLHRLVGITVPRDADQQFDAGRPVEPPFAAGDVLFFGSGRGHRDISHMAVSLGGWRILHASRARNGVYEDDVQAVDWLRDVFRGGRTFIRGAGADS